MNSYYVYIYMDPRKRINGVYDGLDFSFLYEPFYIGKGKDDRYISHVKDYRLCKKSYLSNKIKNIKSDDIDPIIVKIFENLSEEDAFFIEKNLITSIGKKINKSGPLVNIVDGGGGVSGLIHTDESRIKMSLKGELHPNWGKSLKDSTKEKISIALKKNNPMKNKQISEKVRLKNIGRDPWNKGLKTSDEVKSKLSEKKIKYRNIRAICKVSGDSFTFDNTNYVTDFLKRTHRMVMIYFERGESKDYYWFYDKSL